MSFLTNLPKINIVTDVTTYLGKDYDSRHGSPFDRGAADSYYSRVRRQQENMTEEEYDSYCAGYDYNKEIYNKKDF